MLRVCARPSPARLLAIRRVHVLSFPNSKASPGVRLDGWNNCCAHGYTQLNSAVVTHRRIALSSHKPCYLTGEDDELRITGESGIDTQSLPHHRYLCRKHPFDKATAAAADGFSNAPACDNCWCAVT